MEFSPGRRPGRPHRGVTLDVERRGWSGGTEGDAAPGPRWEPTGAATARAGAARARPLRADHQPLALLPERILSLVLRIVVVFFVLITLVTIAESA